MQVAGRNLAKSNVLVLSAKPVYTVEICYSNPSRFALTDIGQLVVSHGSSIHRLTPSGRLLRSIELMGKHQDGACGVALPASGDILVCDKSNTI